MPYGVFQYNEIITYSYIISKSMNTSYSDILDMSVAERDKLIELIDEQNKKDREDLEKASKKSHK